MDEIGMTIFINSNYGHDKVIGKSITGLIGFLGGTSITWFAKRQLSVMTSTFSTEFTSLKKAVEEAVAYRYYCRAFGMRMIYPTTIYEDNMSIVLNTSDLDSNLNQKSMALSYHFCHEHIANSIVEVRHVNTKENLLDALTKGLESLDHHNCFMSFMSN